MGLDPTARQIAQDALSYVENALTPVTGSVEQNLAASQAAAATAQDSAATATSASATATTQAGIATGAATTASTQATVATTGATTATAQASLSAIASANAQVAAAIQNTLSVTPTALPYEVTGIAMTAAGSGGTANSGPYALAFANAPSGVAGTYRLTSSGAVDPTSITLSNPGLSPTSSSATVSFPLGGVSGATATVTVGTVQNGRKWYAPLDATGLQLGAWGNNGGVLNTAPFGLPQLKFAVSSPVTQYETLSTSLKGKLVLIGTDGYVVTSLPAAASASLTGTLYDTLSAPGKTLMVGSDGYIIAKIDASSVANTAELTTARGTRADLNTRLSEGLTEYGLPVGPWKRQWALHRWRRDWASLLYGSDAGPTRPIIAAAGDSYSTSAYYWTYWLKARLDQLSAQNGGIGWCGFGDPGGSIGINANVYITGANGAVAVAKTGTGWASNYGTASHPSICDAYSSTIADRYTITVTKTDRPVLTAAVLHANGGEGGIIRYRWNGGAWTTVALSTSGIQLVSLAGFPTTTAAFTLDVEVDPTSTGIVRLYGVDLVSTATGAIFHKLGATGCKIQQHATASATASWQAALVSMAPTLITLGTPINDRNGARSPAQYAADVQTIITNARSVLPQVEFLLWFPGEILGLSPSPTYPFTTHMREYRKACEPLLDANDAVAMLDFQHLLPGNGDPTKYGPTTAFPFLYTDLTHPSNPFGARLMHAGFESVLIKN